MSRSRYTTMHDVARKAGVGVATVDRVLNERAPVAPETAARVLAAAESVGYRGKPMIRRRIAELAPACRFGFLLQKKGKWVYQTLEAALRQAVESRLDVRADPVFSFVGSLSADRLADEIRNLGKQVDALAVVSIDHPSVAAAITECAEAGVSVYSLLSPLEVPQLAGHIGVDAYVAGRTAGWAMSRLAPREAGEIGLLIGSQRYLGHQLSERGFRDAMRDHAPMLRLRETMVYLDDEAVAFEAAQELLHRGSDLVGLYHSGGGVRGVASALDASGMAQAITYICHARSPDSEAALWAGTADLVIAVDFEQLAATLVRCMSEAVRKGHPGPPPAPARFELLTIENV